jgi:prevent-host-death family protein
MHSVGSFEAKTHFAAILERVAKGESIQITRRGVPVAKLVPAGAPEQKDLKKIAEEIRELRKGNFLGGLSIRELIAQGRRY